MRAALLAATRAAALLQRRVPEGGAGLVAVEGAGEIPGHRARATEKAPAKTAASAGFSACWRREGGAGLVAVEGAGEIPGHRDRQTETQRAKPALSGARQEPKTAGRRSRSRRREGNPYRVFSTPVVTGPAATRGSCASGARRGRGSARTRVGVRWSASGSVSAGGNRHVPVDGPRRCGQREWRGQLIPTY